MNSEEAITAPVFQLCQWAADYYQHSLGEVLAAALPTQLRTQDESWHSTVVRWQLTQKGRLIGLVLVSQRRERRIIHAHLLRYRRAGQLDRAEVVYLLPEMEAAADA